VAIRPGAFVIADIEGAFTQRAALDRLLVNARVGIILLAGSRLAEAGPIGGLQALDGERLRTGDKSMMDKAIYWLEIQVIHRH
jgi:hypothetical protein